MKKFLLIGAVVAVLAACGDDSSSNSVTNADEDSSSSVIASDTKQSGDSKSSSSSEKAKSSSSSSVTASDVKQSSDSKSSSSSEKAKSSSSSSVTASDVKQSSDSESSSSSSEKAKSSSSSAKSSSSDASSSSVVQPSSSVAYVEPCRTDSVDTCEYGTLTDDRDGQTYKTVKIGEQWWMAENLNYRYIQQTAEEDSSSYCYNDDPANCAKYGRLYLWSAAMDSAGVVPGNTANGCGYVNYCNLGNGKVRGVCPEGWHLPDTTEWKALFTAVEGWATAGKMLKSTEGWNNNGNGSDSYSFSALSAGYRSYNGDFDYEGGNAYFWSSTEYFWSSTENYSNYAYFMYLDYDYDNAYLNDYLEDYGFSVRCLKD